MHRIGSRRVGLKVLVLAENKQIRKETPVRVIFLNRHHQVGSKKEIFLCVCVCACFDSRSSEFLDHVAQTEDDAVNELCFFIKRQCFPTIAFDG